MKRLKQLWSWLFNPWHGFPTPHWPDPWKDHDLRKKEKAGCDAYQEEGKDPWERTEV